MFFSKILLGARYIQSAYSLWVRQLKSKLLLRKKNAFDQVITAFYSDKIQSTESSGIQDIESIRKRLFQSKAEIKRLEFGEGSNILSHTFRTEKVSDICRYMSKSHTECRFLYTIIKTHKPKEVIELGTCLGISTAYLGMALKQNGKGELTSFEGSPDRAEIAIQNINDLGLENTVQIIQGRFQDTLPDYLEKTEFIDFAFIDGHHQEDATLHYFNIILPKFIHGGVIVLDDIYWSAGMCRAWNTIQSHHMVSDSFVFRGMGIIGVSGKA